MHVANQHRRGKTEKMPEAVQRFRVEAKCLPVLQVTDILALQNGIPFSQGKRIYFLRTESQDTFHGNVGKEWLRYIAARTAHQARLPAANLKD